MRFLVKALSSMQGSNLVFVPYQVYALLPTARLADKPSFHPRKDAAPPTSMSAVLACSESPRFKQAKNTDRPDI